MTAVTASSSLRRNEIITGLALPLLVIAGFAAGEVALRLVERQKFGDAANVDRSDVFFRDPTTQLRLATPGAAMGKVRINAHGFRGPPLAIPKPPRTLRIAYLGSSTTFSAEVPEGRDWPSMATAALARTLPANCRAEHVNAGMPGFAVRHMRTLFEARVRPLQPDMVVVLPGDVSADIADDLRAQGHDPNAWFRRSWLAERSVLWRKVERSSAALTLERRAFDQDGKIAVDLAGNAAAFGKRLGAFMGEIRSAEAQPAVATISSRLRRDQSRGEQLEAVRSALVVNPYTSIPDMVAAREGYNAQVRRVAVATGATLVDVGDAVPSDPANFVDSAHFSVRGSAIMGDLVANSIAASPAWRAAVSDACPG